ncbi:demethylmenaquinone methyltransferase [Ferviditalea candida]|uniref:Demethylmenaquinone methyltransferase n=1 Tax=Ferviditalea candida TaxID=3108399 RepID=A0ABU5ZMT2_9BACL|nr:demethylmenaquinone methyltransferase [Paenibacillaceae bacterium T2]
MDRTNSKEQFVHSVFESIANKYDMMNDLLSFRRHRAWRKFTMKKMNVQPGDTAADICCGTCDWTVNLAQESRQGRIVGLDFSENMLEIGRQKLDKLGLNGQVQLVCGNAMDLPFEDNQFDYATIGFGLRNVPDIGRVLSEMRRVVKPGGKVVCLELSKPVREPFKSIYYFYFQRILPFIGKIVAQKYEQYKWLPESLAQFPDHRELAQIFKDVGLERVEVYPLTGGVAALHIGEKGK